MSDFDHAGAAWVVPPGSYLATRPPQFSSMRAPVSQYVTMDDDVRLAIDVILPDAPMQTFATIVLFTPYGRRYQTSDPSVEPSPNTALYRDFFVPRGYALVVVDVRGTGASFGYRDSLRSPRERDDSRKVCDWIVDQPWSNGVVGSTGISYLGAAACFLASTGHPAVKAIAPLFAVSDIHTEQFFPGGLLSRVWSEDYDELMLALDQNDKEKRARFAYFGDPRLVRPHPVEEDEDGALVEAAIAGHRANFRLHELMPEVVFRGEGPLHDASLTTDACSPFTYLLSGARSDVAIYSVSGWYDGGGYANGAISRFLSVRGPNNRLLLGPWDHGARVNISPWRARKESDFPLLAEVLRFFDEHLLGMDTGIRQEAPVHYFNVHGERWISAPDWTVQTHRALHLQPAGGLSSAPGTKAHVDIPIDPSDSTGRHTRWERLGATAVDSYYDDWRTRSASHLAFTSAPYESETEFSGHAIADLWVSTAQKDAAVYLYLSEVESDGQVRYITEGMLRALHRATAQAPPEYRTAWPYRDMTRTSAAALEPGVPAQLLFALLPVSWTLKAGSRLRVSIAGADADHFPTVPNGGAVSLRLHLGGGTASRLLLPVRASSNASL